MDNTQTEQQKQANVTRIKTGSVRVSAADMRHLINHFKDVVEDVNNLQVPFAICNVTHMFCLIELQYSWGEAHNLADSFIPELYKSWEFYSGNIQYPVPATKESLDGDFMARRNDAYNIFVDSADDEDECYRIVCEGDSRVTTHPFDVPEPENITKKNELIVSNQKAYDAYMASHRDHYWRGEYGELRLDLLKHIIAKLEPLVLSAKVDSDGFILLNVTDQ